MSNNKSLYFQLKDILDDVQRITEDASESATRKAGNEARKILKNTSPEKTGEYAGGWATKRTQNGVIVYNAKLPGLTHLLEHGHVVRNKSGRCGRAPAIKHIEPAAEKGSELCFNTAIDSLNKKL